MLESQLFEIVTNIYKKNNKENRINHVKGVYNLSMKVASFYNLDLNKIATASILHDICKYFSLEEMVILIDDEKIIKKYPFEIYHAYAGAKYCEKYLNIKDLDVINSIRYHVFGRINMTIYEKIIMLCDFAEEGRTNNSAKIIRNILLNELNLDKAVYYFYLENISYLEKHNIKVLDEQYELRKIYKEKLC